MVFICSLTLSGTNFDNITATGIINKSLSEHDSLTWNSKLIEARYAYENEFLFAVTQGNYPKAKHLMSQFNSIQIDQRNADPIRDMKNYCIIINTLFRKAVERGGVHPIHIDSVSGEFAKKIELRSSVVLFVKLFQSFKRNSYDTLAVAAFIGTI